MAETTVIHEKNVPLVAAVALVAGDIITVDSAGKYAKTAAGEEVFFVCLKGAAAGDLAVGVRYRVCKVNCSAVNNAGNIAIAVGDSLYVGAGVLSKNVTTGLYAVAKAMETLTSGTTGIIRVMLKE